MLEGKGGGEWVAGVQSTAQGAEATASQQMTARHRLERLEKLVIDRMSAMTPQQRVAALEKLKARYWCERVN